jgi:hypothetical protein
VVCTDRKIARSVCDNRSEDVDGALLHFATPVVDAEGVGVDAAASDFVVNVEALGRSARMTRTALAVRMMVASSARASGRNSIQCCIGGGPDEW